MILCGKESSRRQIRFRSYSLLKKLIFYHYFTARLFKRAGRKVAWVTSGAPVEILLSFGIIPQYPENHSAICSASHLAARLRDIAIGKGFSADLCSYALVDIGSIVSGQSPVGGMAKPDILICCNNICGTVLKWYEYLSKIFGVELIFIDTPFLNDEICSAAGGNSTIPSHWSDYVLRQFEYMIERLESVTGRSFDERRFKKRLTFASKAMKLWEDILNMCIYKPSPMSCFDAFIHMNPIVIMRGTYPAVMYYRKLKGELLMRVTEGVGAVEQERYRLVWDNIPVWDRLRSMRQYFEGRRACLVADSYSSAWAEGVISPDVSLRDYAVAYASIFLNRGLLSKAERIVNLMEKYDADGFVLHCNRSCKPYSVGQYDILRIVSERTGKRGIVIEADHVDGRFFNETGVFSALDAFFENL